MIHLLIPYTIDFTKETFLGRLEAIEVDLEQFRELARVETTFSALNVRTNLTRSTSMHGDFSSIKKSNEDKIEEGVALLVKREKDGKKFFKCCTCMNMLIMHLSVLKDKINTKESLDLGDVEIVCMLMKKKNQIRVEVMMN